MCLLGHGELHFHCIGCYYYANFIVFELEHTPEFASLVVYAKKFIGVALVLHGDVIAAEALLAMREGRVMR